MPLSQVNPDNYQLQLEQKLARIRKQFAAFALADIEVLPSPPLHYRLRAEFKIWHEGEDSFYAMFKPGQKNKPFRVDNFPIGSETINRLMAEILAAVKASNCLRNRLFQIEFLTTLSGQALVSMIYHKPLDEKWQLEARTLQERLNIKIIGRSRKQRLVLSEDYVIEQLEVDGQSYQYQQIENSFTQPNGEVNQHMLSWARHHSSQLHGDLLELYCGSGNFTAVLADNFSKVLATEISKTSVRSAEFNFKLNNISNVQLVRMSSEDFSAALKGERLFKRLRDIELKDFQFSTLLVDPPRAGLDEGTLALASGFDNILYISCNPDTLYSNLETLNKTHSVKHFAVFDQFPYTDHIECGVMLERKLK